MWGNVVLLGGKKQDTKFNIIGFPKCGQVSMQSYLSEIYTGYNIRRDEIMWKRSGVEDYEKIYGKLGVRPIIILRDPIEAIWSYYWYMGHGDKNNPVFMEYEEFLVAPNYNEQLGEENPISCYNFNKWIKRFTKFKPIIIELEEMKKNPNFPLLNPTSARVDMVEIPDHYKDTTRTLLDKEIEEHPDPCWSIDYM